LRIRKENLLYIAVKSVLENLLGDWKLPICLMMAYVECRYKPIRIIHNGDLAEN